jgi:hypothetical protein
MATPLDALLRIKAQVTGAPAVQALGGAIGGVQKQAAGAVGALRRMGAASGGLGGALGALTPLLSAAGLGAMAMNAINAGDAMFDMSQRTGVSVEMLGKFDKAAKMSGTSIEAVGTGLARLARSMAAAAGGGFGEKTKQEMDQAKDAIEQGEKAAVRAVERGADRRMDVLDRETGRRLDKLAKRYRREEQLLNDSFDDQAAAADEAAQDQTDAQIKAIDRLYEARRKAVQNDKALSEASQSALLQQLEDQRDAELEVVRDAATKAQTIRQRASRDARQEVLDGLDERRKAEEDALKASTESQKDAIKEATRSQVESIKEIADQQKKAIGGGDDRAEEMDALGLSGKGASDAFRELEISLRNSNGTMKTTDQVFLEISRKFATMEDGYKKVTLAQKLFGRGGVELIPMLNMGGDAIERLKSKMTTEFAAAADQYSDKLVILGGKIGGIGFQIAEAMLPYIEKITDALTGFFTWLDKQDPVIKQIVTGVGLAVIAFAALSPAIFSVVSILGVLGAIGAGPIALIVAAVVALGIAFMAAWNRFAWFRDGIMNGLKGLAQAWSGIFTMIKGIVTGDGKLVEEGFKTMWAGILKAMSAAFGLIKNIAVTTFLWLVEQVLALPGRLLNGALAIGRAIGNGIASAVRSILTGMFNWIADRINGAVDAINFLIRAFNSIPGVPDIGTINRVPRFAQGGYVTAPTLGLVGEAGREYIVPESKAAGFANNIMAGRRGAAAIPSGSSSSGGGGTVSINITTGPVRQDASGQRWMTLEDGEKMVRQAVGQMQRTSRTPGGRYSAGVR